MKWTLRLMILLVLLTALVLTLARHEDSGWIAFASDRSGEQSIYLMNGDGDHQRRISDELTCALAPQWSADAAWIAFSNPCSNAGELLRMRPDGSRLHVVSSVPSHSDSSRWSPDREQLVVTRNPSSLYIMQANGDGERYIANDYYFPQWSPDGDWIYARPIFDDRSSLDRIHVTTGEVESLLPPQTDFYDLDWSPEADQIVLGMSSENGDELFLMNPDGGNLHQISDDLPDPLVFEARWSPDGEWIALVAGDAPRAHNIYRVRPDGSDLQRLAPSIYHLTYIEWSPDSVWLLYEADLHASRGIFRLRADGSQVEILTPGAGDDYTPQYAPISGRHWHPFWVTLAALGMLVLSMVRRSRR